MTHNAMTKPRLIKMTEINFYNTYKKSIYYVRIHNIMKIVPYKINLHVWETGMWCMSNMTRGLATVIHTYTYTLNMYFILSTKTKYI